MDRIPRKKKKQIPKDTHYCYTVIGWPLHRDEDGRAYIETKTCPFYEHVEHEEGWCRLVKCEVDDQCKSCGVRKKKF